MTGLQPAAHDDGGGGAKSKGQATANKSSAHPSDGHFWLFKR